jgi:hypothetical protein
MYVYISVADWNALVLVNYELLNVSNLNFDDLLLVRATTTGVVYCTEVIYWGVGGGVGDRRAVKEKCLLCRTLNVKIGRVIG